MLDYVMTIDSDNEEPTPGPSKKAGEEVNLNPELSFDVAGDAYIDFGDPFATNDVLKLSSKPELISIDEIIARRATRKRKLEIGDTESESEEDDELSDEELDRDNFSDAEGVSTRDGNEEGGSELEDETEDDHDGNSSSDDSEEETQAEKERKAAFFDTEDSSSKAHESFVSMNLSRPILKALTSLGFQQPTPIQSATVPVALLGKDVVGNAVTGSGKTAAFIIPIIERLLYRDKGKHAAATRCIILCPTRELAAQCYEVGTKLASHTDIRLCLIVGGLSLKSQESSLRTRPDIVVATPGRLIDHIRNSPSFSLDALDVLVLDEADRMLSEGFADELNEIIKTCPKSRQTMLFSATMTDSVDELVRMSLNKPVRLFVDPKKTTAKGLVQEFVRVRSTKESERSAILVALCKRVFKSNVIVFLRSKRLAHQMRIVFGLLGMNCEELHGDLTQEQRLKALQHFRDGKSDFLMATDLASRGLDIKGVQTVINYDMPSQLAQYLHRVGRTARAGKKGRSVTLVGEADRKFLKAAIKHASDQDRVRHRVIPAEVISRWSQKLTEMKDEISMILLEEKEQKQIRQAEMELKKGENMIQHEEEIFSRPARTWFQSGKEKLAAQAISKQKYEGISTTPGSKSDDKEKPKRDKFAGLSRKAKRRKMLDEEEKKEGDKNGINAAIRSAKKASRPTKLQTFKRATEQSQSLQKSKSKKRSESGFSQDLADRSRTNKAGRKSGKGRGRL